MTKLMKFGAAAALTVMTAVAAQAADLPTKKAPVAPVYVPPPFTWTGFYVGVNAGGIWSTGNANVNAYFPAGNIFYSNYNGGSISNGVAGFLGGAQAGYNFQSGAAVFGIETDFDGTSLSKSRTRIGGNFPALGVNDYFTTNSSIRLSWLGTTRARVGFVATPDNRLMFYGTGGLAYGGGSANYSIYDLQQLGAWGGSKSSTRVGWTIGAGAEYALTNNVTLKGEYLYYSLGSSTTLINPLSVAAFPNTVNTFANAKVNYNGSIFRVGVNYKF